MEYMPQTNNTKKDQNVDKNDKNNQFNNSNCNAKVDFWLKEGSDGDINILTTKLDDADYNNAIKKDEKNLEDLALNKDSKNQAEL